MKTQLFKQLYKLTGCKTIRGAKRKITQIENSYTSGKVATTKEGYAGGRVMSDQYQMWAYQRIEAEKLIKQIEKICAKRK